MKVHLRMLGCRLNQAEIERMGRQLAQQGHEVVDAAEQADQIIVNTCAVTQDAVKAGRRLIREAHRSSPQAQISVTGCHAQLAASELAALPGVVRVVGNAEKDEMVSLITGQHLPVYELEPLERTPQAAAGLRTRAFIKVQDGCDNACTFCVTTIARGAGRSRPADEIVQEIRALHAAGYQEAVLTGVHLGSYGHDLGQRDGLAELVRRILGETELPRLRLSSLEPWDLEANFFRLWADARLCPHLHLPLQNGCDATLKRMRRNTNQAAFRALVDAARAAIPDLRLTTDIIAGFPGETDAEFAESEAFVRAMDFSGLHVFRYSARPGTPAARMRPQIPEAVRKARSQRLIALGQAQEEAFAQRHLGRTLPVLWEQVSGASEAGFIQQGYTHNYLRVQAQHPRPLTNLLTPATLGALAGGTIHAIPVIE